MVLIDSCWVQSPLLKYPTIYHTSVPFTPVFFLFLFDSILGHTPTVQDPGEEDRSVDRVCSSKWRDGEVLSHCSPPDLSQPLQSLYYSNSYQVTPPHEHNTIVGRFVHIRAFYDGNCSPLFYNLVDHPILSYFCREEFESKDRHWGTILTSNARYM